MTALHWRALAADDLDAVMAIAAEVHPSYPERRDTFAEKLALAPDACFALDRDDGALAGYAVAYPWRARQVAPLDALFGTLPADADTLYVHDVAVLPAARGRGRAAEVIARMADAARRRGLDRLSLMAVYGSQALWQRHGFTIVQDDSLARQLAPFGPAVRYMERNLGGPDVART